MNRPWIVASWCLLVGLCAVLGVGALAGLGAAPPTAEGPRELRFFRHIPPAGSSRQSSYLLDISVQTKVFTDTGERLLPLHRRRRKLRMTEVIEAVNAEEILRARVSYQEAVTVDQKGKRRRTKRHRVEGKSYRITMAAGSVGVTYPDGGRPHAIETRRVRSRFARLWFADPLQKALLGRTVRIGSRSRPLEKVLALAVMREASRLRAPSLRNVRVILKEIKRCEERPCGVFSVNLDMKTKPFYKKRRGSSFRVTLRVKGEFTVLAAGALPLALDLVGPLELSAALDRNNRRREYEGSGQLHMRYRNERRVGRKVLRRGRWARHQP